MTSVVNVKVSHIRPKYKDLREWMKDPNNIYIGRRGIVFIDKKRFPDNDSLWANPFKITDDCDRDEVVVKYEKYIRKKIMDENLRDNLMSLDGKILGCWCKSGKMGDQFNNKNNIDIKCHGDVLIKLINEHKNL